MGKCRRINRDDKIEKIEVLFNMDNINTKLIAPCGFYCGSCPTYLNDECEGCYNGGAGKCFTFNCVVNKDINFCGECKDFPCDDIIDGEKATILDKSWLKWKKGNKK